MITGLMMIDSFIERQTDDSKNDNRMLDVHSTQIDYFIKKENMQACKLRE